MFLVDLRQNSLATPDVYNQIVFDYSIPLRSCIGTTNLLTDDKTIYLSWLKVNGVLFYFCN